MALWQWNKALNRYQVTKQGAASLGIRPGTIISQSRMVVLRDAYTAQGLTDVSLLASDLASGKINLTQWVTKMRTNVKNAYLNQYTLAGGGHNNMTQADWGRIGRELRDQYGFLNRFAGDIQDGKLTEAQINARAQQYINGSTQMYERAAVLKRGMPDLPQYPGDGNQDCYSNCKCTWDIQEFDDRWECTWILDAAAEHCDTCIDNAGMWNPLIIYK